MTVLENTSPSGNDPTDFKALLRTEVVDTPKFIQNFIESVQRVLSQIDCSLLAVLVKIILVKICQQRGVDITNLTSGLTAKYKSNIPEDLHPLHRLYLNLRARAAGKMITDTKTLERLGGVSKERRIAIVQDLLRSNFPDSVPPPPQKTPSRRDRKKRGKRR